MRLPMKDKMVPIKFPENIDEMLDNWANCAEENLGACSATARSAVRMT